LAVATEQFDVAASLDTARSNSDETDSMEALKRVLAQIPPKYDKYKQAVDMYHLQKLPDDVIAEKLGIAASSVKMYVNRGLKKCKEVAK